MKRLLPLFFIPLCLIQSSTAKAVFDAAIDKGEQISPQWKLNAASDCKPVIETSPKGGCVFIGKIPVGKQALALTKLPDHKHLRIQFDLILKGTWDGIHT